MADNTGNKDLITIPATEPTVPQIDLETSRRVLKTIVATHEDSFTDSSALDQIAGYKTEQVREAVRAFGKELFKSRPEFSIIPSLTKKASLQHYTIEAILFTPENWDFIRLTIHSTVALGRKPFNIIEDFPLSNDSSQSPYSNQFFDTREGGAEANIDKLKEEGPNLDKYKVMIKGLRWLSANMLSWDHPGVIMPEQLDHLPLPSPATPQAS